MVLKPNKPPASYQKPTPFHYNPSTSPIQHFRQRVSQFKNNSTLRCYWMAGQEHFNNTYYFSDQSSLHYRPPTLWPVHGAPLRIPRMVNIYLVFPSQSSDGDRADAWESIRAQLNSFFNDYVGMYVCEDAGAITPDAGGSNFRWLQFMCPRREDVVTSNTDSFLGSDHLHIVIYNDLGLGTDLGGNPILLDGTLPTSYFSFFRGYNDDRWDRLRLTHPTTIALAQQAYQNDVQALKNAYPSFVRSKTLVYFNSTKPAGPECEILTLDHSDGFGINRGPDPIYVGNNILSVILDSWFVNGGVITEPVGGEIDYPVVIFSSVPQDIYLNGFRSSRARYLLDSPGPPFRAYWILESHNVWDEIASNTTSWLTKVSGDLSDFGWEYKGNLETSDGFNTLKGVIMDYFQLTDKDLKS